jgi:hypothetical protein
MLTMENMDLEDSSEEPGGCERPGFCKADLCLCARLDQERQELSNIFKSLFEGEPAEMKNYFAALSNLTHSLVDIGSPEQLLKCLKGVAENYLSSKATQLTGLIGMDLIDALSALWTKYQDTTSVIGVCMKSLSAPTKYEVDDLLLKAFKYIIVMPEQYKCVRHFDFYMKNRRPVHAIHFALRGTLSAAEVIYPFLETNFDRAIGTVVEMLTTLDCNMFIRLPSNIETIPAKMKMNNRFL